MDSVDRKLLDFLKNKERQAQLYSLLSGMDQPGDKIGGLSYLSNESVGANTTGSACYPSRPDS